MDTLQKVGYFIVFGAFVVFLINNASVLDDVVNSIGRLGINEYGVLSMQQGYPRAL